MVFKTKSNYYFYSKRHNRIILIHPLLAQVIEAKESSRHSPPLTGRKYKYYIDKYELLKERGYFDPPDIDRQISGRYTGGAIRAHLHNNKLLVFEVTDACNLKCKYCGYGEFYCGYDKRKNRNLGFEKARTLLDYMVPFWNSPSHYHHQKGIRLGFYGGEPLMNFPFIRKTVRYAESIPLENNYFTFGMTTNGVILDKYIDYLVEKRFRLLISLDGDQECNGFRVFHNGKPAFDTIYRNICLVREKYPDYFHENVKFQSVLHRLNSVERIYDFFKTRFDKIPGISSVSPFGIKESMKEHFEKVYVDMSDSFSQAGVRVKNETLRWLRGENIRRVADILYNYSANTFKRPQDLLPATAKQTIPTGTCVPLNRKIFLNVNGKILPCERVSSSHACGTVSGGRVHIDFDEIARKYNGYFDRLAQRCRQCFSTRKCSNCILQMEEHKDRFKCPAFTSREQLGKSLAEGIRGLEENPGLYKRIVKEYFLE